MQFTSKEAHLVHIHIPGTAGTSIEKMLCQQFQVDYDYPTPNITNLFGFYKKNKNQYFQLAHLTWGEMIKHHFVEEREETKVFTIVRNPFSRIPSLHRRFFGSMTLEAFLTMLQGHPLQNYAHDGIKSDVVELDAQNMLRHPELLTYFFLPQRSYIENSGSQVFYFESLDKINLENVSTNIIKKPLKIPTLSKAERQLIRQLYKIDFEEFGYSKSYRLFVVKTRLSNSVLKFQNRIKNLLARF